MVLHRWRNHFLETLNNARSEKLQIVDRQIVEPLVEETTIKEVFTAVRKQKKSQVIDHI